MQANTRPADIAKAVVELLDNPERRRSIADRFARLRTELAQNTDQRAADAVVSLLK